MKKNDQSVRRSVDQTKKRLDSQDHAKAYMEAQKQRLKNKQQEQQIIDDLVESVYAKRYKLIKFNFWRGVSFGLGSALGGTIVLAVVLWLLGNVVDWFPLIGDFVREVMKYVK